MDTPAWISAAALLAVGAAAALGPVRLTCRAVLRRFGSRDIMRHWQVPVTYGVQAGLPGAVALAAWTGGPQGALLAAVTGLLSLLATLDLAWRWLPFAWTLPLLALGMVAAPDWAIAAAGAATGAGLLWALQLYYRLRRGIDALGTGDIWLAAGLGALTDPARIGLILGLAAVTALGAEILSRTRHGPAKPRRMGVAYGAHLCAAYIILFPF